MLDEFKGTLIQENRKRDNKLTYYKQITNLIVWLSLT